MGKYSIISFLFYRQIRKKTKVKFRFATIKGIQMYIIACN